VTSLCSPGVTVCAPADNTNSAARAPPDRAARWENPPRLTTRGVCGRSELGCQSEIEERSVESERTTDTRVYLTIDQAVRLGVYLVAGTVGDPVRIRIEDVLAAEGDSHVAPYRVGHVDVRGPLGREQLSGIIVFVPVRAVVVLVQHGRKRTP